MDKLKGQSIFDVPQNEEKCCMEIMHGYEVNLFLLSFHSTFQKMKKYFCITALHCYIYACDIARFYVSGSKEQKILQLMLCAGD